jgi:hypothetical protein
MSLTAVDAMVAAREKEVRTREVSEIYEPGCEEKILRLRRELIGWAAHSLSRYGWVCLVGQTRTE